jgi:hypothetical protein
MLVEYLSLLNGYFIVEHLSNVFEMSYSIKRKQMLYFPYFN